MPAMTAFCQPLQVVPFQCRIMVLTPVLVISLPTAQILRAETAATLLRTLLGAGFGLRTRFQPFPFQCRISVLQSSHLEGGRPADPTAQAFRLELAATLSSEPQG